MSPTAEIERLIGDARARVSAGRQCIALRQRLDLRGLEAVVAQIGETLSHLARETALSQRNALIVLFDELGQLDQAITRLQRDTAGQLKRMSSRRYATSAYNNPNKT